MNYVPFSLYLYYLFVLLAAYIFIWSITVSAFCFLFHQWKFPFYVCLAIHLKTTWYRGNTQWLNCESKGSTRTCYVIILNDNSSSLQNPKVLGWTFNTAYETDQRNAKQWLCLQVYSENKLASLSQNYVLDPLQICMINQINFPYVPIWRKFALKDYLFDEILYR